MKKFVLLAILASVVCSTKLLLAQSTQLVAVAPGTDKAGDDIKKLLQYYDKKIYFTENKGQWEDQVLYKASFPLGQAIATKEGMMVGTYDPVAANEHYNRGMREEKAKHDHVPFNEPAVNVSAHAWLMKFVNSSPSMTVEAKEKHGDLYNYFTGGASKYETKVSNYQEIWYNNVYNGVDVRYYPSAQGTLEYDIVCKPGFNKDNIAIKFDGIDKMEVTKTGHLVFKTSVGDVDFPAPVAYQKIGNTKKSVTIKYIVSGNTVTFDLGDYNKAYPLIIDPIALRWATWVTSNSGGDNHGHGIWVDPRDGSIYVVARVDGSTNLISSGHVDKTSNGGIDLVVGKYKEPATVGGAGSRVWQTYIGGSSDDNPYALEMGPDGNIYITGYTSSTDYPLKNTGSIFTGSSIDDRSQTTDNIFITKIDTSGTSIKSSVIGGNGDDGAFDLRINAAGDIIMCGNTKSTNLNTIHSGLGASNTNHGDVDVIVLKISQDLSTLKWIKNYGGSDKDQATIMLTNTTTGDIYVAGYTQSTDFPTVNARTGQSSLGGSQDGFIQKLNSSGTTVWSSYFKSGSSKKSSILCMEFNSTQDKIFIGGLTEGLNSANISSSGVYKSTITNNSTDFFVARMDTNQNFNMGTYIGGNSNEANMMGLNTDLNNDVYVFGYTPSTNFPVTSDALQSSNNGSDDKVFFKLSSDLSTLKFSTYYGGTSDDYDPVGERGIKFSNCRIYTIVTAESNDIPLTQGAVTTTKSSSASTYEPGLVVWANPPDLSGNTITASQNLCKGSTAADLIGSAPSYSLPTISRNGTTSSYPVTLSSATTYQWQISTDSTNWTNISGGTTQNLAGSLIGAVNQKTYIRRIIGGDACIISGAANQTVVLKVFTISSSITNNTCFGQSNGSITITPSDGTAPYTYHWGNGATTQSVTSLATGAYPVTVTDHAGCSIVTSYSVTSPTQVTATASNTATSCGLNNGTANSSGSNGTPGYSYNWSTGATTQNISLLAAATYNVTITDVNGCTGATSTTVAGSSAPIVTVNSPSKCSSASVTLTAGGASTYKWSPSTNLSATTGATVTSTTTVTRSYTVTGTDASGCTASATSTVTIGSNPTITVNSPTTCSGVATALTASGAGTGGTYSWSPATNLNAITGASVSASPTLTVIYTVTGTNSSGCSSTAAGTVTVNPLPTDNAGVDKSYCAGGSTTIGATATAGHTYSWSPSTGLTSATASNPTANPTVTTTYTLTETIAATGCSAANSMVVTVNTPVQVTVNNPTTCSGVATALAAVNATTYTWSPATNLNQTTGASVSASPTITTSYTVTGTDGNGCTTSAQGKVTVNTPVQVSVNSPSICSGASTSLTAVNATTYTWSPATNLNQTTGASVSANPTVTTSYTVTGTDANGCTTTAQSKVKINTPIQVTVNNPTTCSGVATTLTAANATTYTWSPVTNLNQTSGASVSANPTITTSYTVTGIDGNGCTTSAQSKVTVNTPVQVTVNNATFCNGASATLTANNATTYTWSPATGLNHTTGASVSANPTITTSYTVTGTDGNGCTTSAQSIVTVNTPVPITVNNATFCNGSSATLTANNATTYTWSPATGLNHTTGASISANPTITTSYTVTGTDGNGCTTSAQSKVTVNTPVQVTVNNATFCNGASATLTVNNATTYTWSPATSLNQTSGASVSANPTITTSYTVTGIDGNGCTTSAQSKVTVNTPVQVTVNNATFCNGASATLTANNATTYTWSPATGLNHTTGASVSANPTTTTSYTVTGTDGNGCTTSAQSIVTVNTPVPVTVNNATFCNGSSATLTANNATTYTWSPATGLNHTTGASVSANPTITTSYTVTGTDGNGCTTSAQSKVTVNTPVQVTVNNSSICNGASSTLTAANATTYTWSPATGLNHTTGASVSANPTITTSYTVTGTDGNGCTTSAQSKVTVNTPVQVTVNSPTTCSAVATSLTAANATTYTWSPAINLSQTTGPSVSATTTITTSYTVTGTDGNGCTTSAQSIVTVNTPIQITVNSPSICNGGSTSLTAANATSYTWSPATGLNLTTGASVSANPTITTSYTVTGTDGNGCTTSAQSKVTVNTPVQVTVNNSSICNGASSTLTAANATTYTWSPATGLNHTTGASVSANPTITTSYTVTGTDGNGCTTSAQSKVTVNTPVQVTVNSPTTCSAVATSLTAANATTYTWSPAINLSQTTGASVSATTTITTSYTVTGTDGNGCTTSAQSIVTVNTPVQITVNSPSICNGTSTSLIAANATSYTWSPATGLNHTTGASVSANPTITTSYTVTGTDGNGCTTSAQSKVTVNTPINVTVNNSTICNGAAASLTSANATTYSWSPATGLNKTTGASVSANPTVTTSYTVTGTDGNGCTTSAQSKVTVNTPVQVTVNSPSICNGGSTSLTAVNAITYTWSPATGLNHTTGASVSANPTVTTSYTVTGTDGNGCTTSAQSKVTVNTPVQITVNSPSICNGGSTSLTAANAATYTWSPATGLNHTTGASVSANPTATTSYTVTGTDGNGCTTSVQSKVTVNTPVQVTVNSPSICNGGSTSLTAANATTYTWSPATGLNHTTGASVSANPTITTSYTVTGTDGNGCTTSAQSKVTVNTPVHVAVNSPSACIGSSVSLTANNAVTYTWSPATNLSAFTGASVTASPTITTSYTVTGTDGNGCTTSAVSIVTINGLPSILVNNPSICPGGAAMLSASGASTYTWSPATNLSATTGATINAHPTSTTTYTVIGTSASGCTGSATSIVSINSNASLSVNNPSICNGGSVTLAVSGASQYEWSPATGLNKTTGGMVLANPTTSTTYSVVATTGSGCTGSAISVVTVNDIPKDTVTGSTLVCSYDNGLLTANASAGSGTITAYQWQQGGADISSATSNTYNAGSTGTYTVIVTNSNGCTAASAGFNVTKNTILSIDQSITDASCSGSSDGSVNITVSGGTPSYTYSWSNNIITEDISNVPSGDYIVTVTDSYGCTVSKSFHVGEPVQLSFTGSVTDANCNGSSNGAINLSVSGGTPSYVYSWSNGATTQNINGLAATTYYVTVSDSHNCSVTQNFTVNQAAPLSLRARSRDASCNGFDDGAVALSVSGGNGGYIYSWSNGATTQSDMNIPVGDYTVTVSDSHGCSATNTQTVGQPDPIVITPFIKNVSCYGESDGSIVIDVIGGIPTDITSIGTGDNFGKYKFSWSNGSSDQNPDSLIAGTYIVTVTDSHGCSAIGNFQVDEPAQLLVDGNAFPATCYGTPTGAVNITVNGGTPEYSYSWSNTAITQNINGVNAGDYNVIVTDAHGCTAGKSFHVDQPAILTLDGTTTDAKCNGDHNGAVNITVGGGSPGYTYSWSNSATTQNLNGVNAGDYIVTVYDSHNCSISKSFIISEPGILTVDGTPVDLKCNNDHSGSINITVGGGSPEYTYSWSNNATTQSINSLAAGDFSVTVFDSHNCSLSKSFHIAESTILILDGTATDATCNGTQNGSITITVGGGSQEYTYSWSNNSTSQNISNIGRGDYSVTVFDSHNCSISKSFHVGEPAQLSLSLAGPVINANCKGDQNGAINITVNGGSPVYTYSWSNNARTQNISGLGASTYYVTVTDSHGCSITQNFTVTQPGVINLNARERDANCYGSSDGAIALSASGGSAGFTYSWSNGATTQNDINVPSGNYSVIVTDSHGCSATDTVVVGQPDPMVLVPTIKNASCYGASDGSIILTVTGGIPTDITSIGTGDNFGLYRYGWSNGSTDQNPDRLTAGDYTVTVTDSHNCVIVATIHVDQPAQLLVDGTATAANCNGSQTGSVNITINGGTPDYTYSWSNNATTQNISGVGSGDYGVTVTDSHGCSASKSFHIDEPGNLTLNGTATDANCNGDHNGSVNITVGGGSPGYTYSWSNSATTQTINGVVAGDYIVTATDSHNCSISKSFHVGEPANLTVDGTTTDASCNGSLTGAVNITVGGGSPEYTYSWSNNATTQNIGNLTTGDYNVTVYDSHNCSISKSFHVGQPTTLSLDGTATDANCNGDKNGSVNISVNGGSPDYTYSWSNNITDQNISGVGAGDYTVTVYDSHNCSISKSFHVGEPTTLTLDGTPTDANCNGDQNGSINITVAGGSPGYTYSWDNGTTTQNISGLGVGSYTVTVTDSHNCSITQSYRVSEPASLSLEGSVTNANCNGDHNGSIDITMSGGSPSCNYSWSCNSTSQNVHSLGAGDYFITATDTHGCQVSETFHVDEPTTITVDGTTTDANCKGDHNCSINITVGGGSADYTYSWSDNSTAQNLNGVGAGDYYVTVYDSHNCSTSKSFHINEPDLLRANVNKNDVSCYGSCDGTININVIGGTKPYHIAWDKTFNDFGCHGVCAGTYCYTVTDAKNCSTSGCVTINQPDSLQVSFDKQDVTCYGACDGSIAVNVNGGTKPYHISWDKTYTDFGCHSVCAGTYCYTVTDGNRCSTSGCVTINQPDSLHVTTDKRDVTCHSSCNGSAAVTVEGGSGDYKILWNKDISGFSPGNLCVGTYCYTVSDSHNCSRNGCIIISEPDTLTVSLQINSSCILLDSCHASVSVLATGGTGTYNYAWSGPQGFTGTNEDTIKGLCIAGVYAITVTDGNGCIATRNAGIICNTCPAGRITIAGPKSTCLSSLPVTLTANTTALALTYTWSSGETTQAISVSTSAIYTVTVVFGDCQASVSDTLVIKPQPSASAQHTDVACHGACNGSVTLTVTNVNAYTTSWTGPNGYTSSNQNEIDNLCAGTYCYTVDADGCTTSGCVDISEATSSLSVIPTPAKASCYGSADGSISLTISGGTPGYSVVWASNQLSGNPATGLSAGSYCYTVYDANKCSVSGCSTVDQPDSLQVSIDKNDVSCYNSCNGSINVNVTGGTKPYHIAWDKTFSDFGCHGVCAGTYCYTVTDANRCSISGCVTISQPDSLQASIDKHDVKCYGNCDGSININVIGGTSPYHISWDKTFNDFSCHGVCIGTYCYTVTDAKNCSTSGCVTINQPDSLQVTNSKQDVSCYGKCNGTIQLSASGGTTPYSYQWDIGDGVVQSSVSDLCIGTYCYSVTDANGCRRTGCVTINQPDSISVGIEKVNLSCNNARIGQITLTAKGGTAPYRYQWDIGDGVVQSSLTGLDAGTYCYTVYDLNGCSKSGCVTIDKFDSIRVTPTIVNLTCNQINGLCDGKISLGITGGIAPYTVKWGENLFGETGAEVADLCPDTYYYIVTDANGCTKAGRVTVSEPTPLLIASNCCPDNITCHDACNGHIDITVFGGTPPFAYSWNGPNGYTSSIEDIKGLCPGVYSLTVTDKNGCSYDHTHAPLINPEPVVSNISHVDASLCMEGLCNGSVSVSPSGGTGPYTIVWTYGYTSSSISGLCQGKYKVTITDVLGCFTVDSAMVLCKQPDCPVVNANPSNITCHGLCNGSITLHISNPSSLPYIINWAGPNSNLATDTVLNNLCVGEYCYTVSFPDIDCIRTSCVIISQPDTISVTTSSRAACYGSCNGIATITHVSGGTAPYKYQWDKGDGAVDSILSSLCPGTYCYSVTDAHGCQKTGCVTIIRADSLHVTTRVNNVSCLSSCNGLIDVEVSGGTPFAGEAPYKIAWDRDGISGFYGDGLCVGTYCYTVTDANDCSIANCITIVNAPPLKVKADSTNLSCSQINGVCDGRISLTITGGGAPYNVSWSDNLFGATGPIMTDLCPDTYCYTVTDANGCNVMGCVTITEPSPLLIASNCCPDNITCHDACNGHIDITVFGGTAPFTYSWNGPNGYISSIEDIKGLCPGVYTVTVTDHNGCTYDHTHAPLINPESIVSNISHVDATNCNAGSCNGNASVSPSGGTEPYTIAWSNGSTANSISGLCNGKFKVTISDKGGCSTIDSVVVVCKQPECPVVTAGSSNATCFGQHNGSATLHINGAATIPYSVSWSAANSNSATDTVLGHLCSGTYCYTVSFTNLGCSKTGCVTIAQPDSLHSTVSVHGVSCHGMCDGSASIDNVSGGTAPYKYQWDIGDGVVQSSISAMCPGTYCYSITDANGCSKTGCATIKEPDSVKVTTLIDASATCSNTCTGSATLSVIGGTPSYSITWDNKNVSGFKPTALCGGTYCYTVNDANACSNIGCITISQSVPLSVSVASTNVSCGSTTNGTATLTVTGGVAPYQYKWNNNATTQGIVSLCAGQYCVTVTAQNGCTASKCVTITQSGTVAISVTSSNVTCNGSCNGSASVTVSGGSAPYTYSWSNHATTSAISGLCTGQYCVTVTNKSGCSASKCITIYQLAPTSISITSSNVTCNGSANGTAKVILNGGVGPFAYHWSNGATTASIVGLCTGEYCVTVTSCGGCPETKCVTISQPTPISMQLKTTNTSCSDSYDGTASVTATGGVTPYGYRWSNGATTQSIKGLSGGSYSVTVSSPGGCYVSKGFVITRPSPVTITLVTTPVTCAHPCSGTATVNVSGGTPPYLYHWANDQTTATIGGLCSGSYTVKVTGQGGCSATKSVSISPCKCGGARTDSVDNTPTDSDSTIASMYGVDNILEVYPNPFNTKTNIELESSIDLNGSLDIYDVSGQKISEVYKGDIKAGQKYTFSFNAEILASGMYICRLTTSQGMKSVSLIKVIH